MAATRTSRSPHVEIVQRIWLAYETDSDQAACARLIAASHPDVEVRIEIPGVDPLVLDGHDGVRSALTSRPLGLLGAKAYGFEAVGDDVIVASWVRVGENGSYLDAQVRWRFEFQDGKLVRVSTLPFAAA